MHETQSRPADSWKFTAANTAVVVVDMQDIWVHPRGARYLPTSEDIVPKVDMVGAVPNIGIRNGAMLLKEALGANVNWLAASRERRRFGWQ